MNILATSSIPLGPEPNGFALRVRHWLRELEPFGLRRASESVTFFEAPNRPTLTFVADESDVLLWWGPPDFDFWDSCPISIVWDAIDCQSLLAAQRRTSFRAWRDWFSARHQDARAARSGVTIVTASPVDTAAFQALGARRVVTIANGVEPVPYQAPDERPIVMFTGTLDYPPNVDACQYFVREIWPMVLDRVPSAEFWITGARPVFEVYDLAQPGNHVKIFPNPENLAAMLRYAWVTVAPMRRGTGIKNKILESWAAGRPCVMTPLAAQGLHALDPKLEQATPLGFAWAVTNLLDGSWARDDYRTAGPELVRTFYHWPKLGAELRLTLLVSVRTGQPRSLQWPQREGLVREMDRAGRQLGTG